MTLFQVFFWFCKREKIMDIVFDIYHTNKIVKHVWGFEGMSIEPMTLKEYIARQVNVNGIYDIFWFLQGFSPQVGNNERFKKARKKWNAFCKNNIKFSENFIKKGDIITIDNNDRKYEVTKVPRLFSTYVMVKSFSVENGSDNDMFQIKEDQCIEVNGLKKKPEYYIKVKRKIYGLDNK